MMLNITGNGTTRLVLHGASNDMAPDSRAFSLGDPRTELVLERGLTEFSISNEIRQSDDALTGFWEEAVVMRNGTTSVMEVFETRILLRAQRQDGFVRVGYLDRNDYAQLAPGEDPSYHASRFNVAELNMYFQRADTSPFLRRAIGLTIQDDELGEYTQAAMVIDSLGPFAPEGYERDAADQYPLYLRTGDYVKAHAPSLFVGNGSIGQQPERGLFQASGPDRWSGGWIGGTVEVNGTGLTQSAPDFPLILHTTQRDRSTGGKAGVVLTGTYKLDVGGIVIYDLNNTQSDSGDRRSTRRILSTGSLRLSVLAPETTMGLVPNPGDQDAQVRKLVLEETDLGVCGCGSLRRPRFPSEPIHP